MVISFASGEQKKVEEILARLSSIVGPGAMSEITVHLGVYLGYFVEWWLAKDTGGDTQPFFSAMAEAKNRFETDVRLSVSDKDKERVVAEAMVCLGKMSSLVRDKHIHLFYKRVPYDSNELIEAIEEMLHDSTEARHS